MAHKPITNDTLMVDMIETPCNKNSQDQILIQDNSAVRTYKEDISSTDFNGSPNALKVTPRQTNEHGNCFFQSALPHIHSLLTVQVLRRTLCDHIDEKAENYVVVFFAAQELSESFEEDITWIDLPNHKN
jgi:hypothetical protein